MAAQEVKKDLQVLVAEDVKKMETLETKDLPALEKALKDYHVACMEVKDVGNKLGAELRRLGEIVPDNEWAACLARVGDVQHFYENIFGDCVEKVLLDGVIEPLKKYAKEESNVAGEHIRKSRAATKAFDELTQKRTAQSLAKKTTTSDMLTILRAEKQEAELKTAMLHFLKAYDSHRCYKLISLINDFMRGQLTYHEAIQQKHRELVVAWKPIVDKKLSDFDVPRDPEDRIEKKGGVEAVHNMQAATRVATTVKNLLPAQYGAALRPSVSRQSLNASTQSPVVSGPPVAKQQVGTMSKKTEIAVMSQPVKPDASATPNAFKTKEAVRGALMALQSHLTELSPSQISMEITRILLLLDDTYIPPTNSSLSSPNLHPGPAPGQPVPAGAALASTHSAPGPSPYIQPKSHSSMQPGKRLSVGSLSEFIEEKPPAKPAPADRVNSSIDEILAGFLDNTKAEGKPAAAPPPAVARPASTANITDELMALITQNNPSPKGSLVAK